MNNEMVRIGNDPESREKLTALVEQVMQEVAADYEGTKEDVRRIVNWLIKQKERGGYQTPIKVPLSVLQEKILTGIAEKFAARDIRPKLISSTGEVLGDVSNKAHAIEQARRERGAA
ncbi:MAG TPA: hypothetical protein VNM40_02600 [Candidatus Paceibacterota bacterium]|nr:hypothetical protein [Candidatus Paceibacterota bacterium]